MSTVEEAIKTLSKNAYIIMAMDGTPLCTSGKRAFHLIRRNFLGIIAINSIGDFVLVMARIFILLLSVFVGIKLITVSEVNAIDLE